MKAAQFDYRAPETVEETLELLAKAPEETSLLAGGQSLVPMLNMRLARPRLLIDLNRVAELRGIARDDGTLRIGAMTRQRALEVNHLAREVPLLIEATRHIAHVPIRTRGTVGGSLAHADPAAELPATVAALDGQIVLRSSRGVRSIAADEFFLGPLTTAREPDEILEAVELAIPPTDSGWAFREVTRTHGAFALVGVAVLLSLHGGGEVKRARLAVFGVGGRPYLPDWLEQMAVGEHPGDALFAAISERVRESIQPTDDQHGAGEYRREVAGVLTARALRHATARAVGAREPGG